MTIYLAVGREYDGLPVYADDIQVREHSKHDAGLFEYFVLYFEDMYSFGEEICIIHVPTCDSHIAQYRCRTCAMESTFTTCHVR